MRTYIYSFILLITTNYSFGQAHTFGTFNFSLGYETGAYYVLFNQKYDDGTTTVSPAQDTSGAVTSLFRFDGQFNVMKFLSVGLQYRGGKYLEDPNNTQAVGNHVSIYGLSIRFYPVNKDKFVWYLGTTLGGSKLIMNKQYTFVVVVPYQYRFRAPHFDLETGFNWYFANNFGVNFGVGYATQKYLMTEYTLNGTKQDLSNWTNTLLSRGVNFNIGLTYHFGGK